MPGEFEFIHWLRTHQRPTPLVTLPAGDDLAVLTWPPHDLLLIGVDQVLDGVHFDSALHTPRQIGAKVMNRNLSDCAAMACLPAAAVVAAALPREATLDYAKELYLGMRDAAAAFDCQIVGGDTATWPGKLALSVTILGRAAGIAPVTRSGAKPGQALCVTGPLGGSILGRHMTFTPRILEARQVAATGRATAMIDLSDGLSRDLAHLCQESNVGATIFADLIPIHDDALTLASRDARTPLEHALHDGEDYELLCAVQTNMSEEELSENLRHLPNLPSAGFHWIGLTTSTLGVRLSTSQGTIPLEPQGWQHEL